MELAPDRQERARRAGQQLAGLSGPVELLGGEHDLNARMGEHIVKLHAADSDRDALRLQDAALRHLAGTAAAAYVPRLVASSLDADPAPPEDPASEGPARVLTWLPGRLWCEAERPGPELLRSLGRVVATVDSALADFSHPAQHRELAWNLTAAPALLDRVGAVSDPDRRQVAERALRRHVERVAPRLAELEHQVIHNDANDRNTVLGDRDDVRGLIDFGDIATAPRICGLAIAGAYATFTQRHPVRDLRPLVAGYHEVSPLVPQELELLLDLMRSRLAASIVMAAWQRRQQPDNEHLLLSHDDAWRVLQRLDRENDTLALCRFRDACGYDAHPAARSVRAWLLSGDAAPAPVLSAPLAELARVTLDWTAGAQHPATGSDDVVAQLAEAGAVVGIGRYCEDRAVYQTPSYDDPDGGDPRTLHLGVDLFAPAGTPVRTPLDGVVAAFHDIARPLDYGPRGHPRAPHRRRRPVLHALRPPVPGVAARAADREARHGRRHDRDDGCRGRQRRLAAARALPAARRPARPRGRGRRGRAARRAARSGARCHRTRTCCCATRQVSTRYPRPRPPRCGGVRRTSLSAALSLSYADPLRIVRGEGCWLYDEHGRGYLDLVNNVAHVGHAHPRVSRGRGPPAVRAQHQHPLPARRADALRRAGSPTRCPTRCRWCSSTNSGSEANDLALRIARAHTGGRDMLVLDHAYHGNLSVADRPVAVQVRRARWPRAPAGDPRRAARPTPTAAPLGSRAAVRTLDGVRELLTRHREQSAQRCRGLLSEPVPGTAGQVVLADGFLAEAYAAGACGRRCVHRRRGADRVRPGRLAPFWGFELHGVVPDIVTMGKPIGNGHPMGAVVTTPQLARSFAGGMEYFNTFGGNPVSASVGRGRARRARGRGPAGERAPGWAERCRSASTTLAGRHPIIGDVRGHGLFLGIELVQDRDSKQPAGAAGRGGRGPDARERRPDIDGRAVPQRAQGETADGDHRRGRRPVRGGARRGAHRGVERGVSDALRPRHPSVTAVPAGRCSPAR